MISVLPSPVLFSIVLKVLNSGVGKKKKIHIRLERKNHNDIIVYMGNSKERECGDASEYKSQHTKTISICIYSQ